MYADEYLAECMAHAAQRNASWVVNLSLGGLYMQGGADYALQRDAVEQFICEAGGIAVAAAGNFGVDVNGPIPYFGDIYDGFYPAGANVQCVVAQLSACESVHA